MPEPTRIPPPPRQSPYGWPLPDRREEFRKLSEQPAGETWRVDGFKGGTVSLPILRVPLNLPKYRISNGRTASAQQEWVSSKHMQADFFDEGDPELEDVQIAQHHILLSMVKDEGLLAKFKDPTKIQVEPVILDENGFVVNGNRRLCCWRMLHHEDVQTYAHFGHIDIVVLPHCDEQELDRLEARLQIEKDIRSDYTWDAEANMMAQKQKLHGFTTPQLAQLYGKSKRDIEDLLAMRALAAEYLVSRGKENAWSEVTREGKVRLFHYDPSVMVMVANPAAAGEGISLHTVCHHAIYLDRSFNAAQYLQSEDRIHRLGLAPGQDTVIEIVECADSVDETVRQRLEFKIGRMAEVLEDSSLRVSPLPMDPDEGDEEDQGGLDEGDVRALLLSLGGRA